MENRWPRHDFWIDDHEFPHRRLHHAELVPIMRINEGYGLESYDERWCELSDAKENLEQLVAKLEDELKGNPRYAELKETLKTHPGNDATNNQIRTKALEELYGLEQPLLEARRQLEKAERQYNAWCDKMDEAKLVLSFSAGERMGFRLALHHISDLLRNPDAGAVDTLRLMGTAQDDAALDRLLGDLVKVHYQSPGDEEGGAQK